MKDNQNPQSMYLFSSIYSNMSKEVQPVTLATALKAFENYNKLKYKWRLFGIDLDRYKW